jgi:hypothetical protein
VSSLKGKKECCKSTVELLCAIPKDKSHSKKKKGNVAETQAQLVGVLVT